MNLLNSYFESSTKLFAFQFSSCQLYFLIPINKIYRIYNFKLITFGSVKSLGSSSMSAFVVWWAVNKLPACTAD